MKGQHKQHDKAKELQEIVDSPLVAKQAAVVVVRKDALVRKWSTDVTKSYVIDKKLGEGSFGEVFLVTHKQLKIQRALKIINKYSKPHSNAADELQLLKKLDHPNILKIYQYFQSPEKWYIITEYFQGMQLFDEIVNKNRLSEHISAQITLEILKALNYIHSNKIAHRDIKAENILIREMGEEYNVKVIDWGLGAIVQGSQLNRKCGTPQYCAPEVLSGNYNIQCDMWSLGVLLYIMLSGYMPFRGNNLNQTLSKVKQGLVDFSLPIWKNISLHAKDFISRLIEKDPQKRIKANQCFSHQWILNYSNSPLKKFKSEQNLEQTLKRIKDFHTQTKFQVVTINYILNFIQTPKQLQRLKRQFEMLDINKDGEISYEELHSAYRKIYGPEADLIVEKIFTNLDLDNSGKITFSEFITFATEITANFSQEQLREAFKLFDSDNDGLIDKRQISGLIKYQRSSRSTSQQVDDIVSEIDLNNDGKIDFGEFIQHISKAVQRVKSKTSSSLTFQSANKTQQKINTSQQKVNISQQHVSQVRQEAVDSKKTVNLLSGEKQISL